MRRAALNTFAFLICVAQLALKKKSRESPNAAFLVLFFSELVTLGDTEVPVQKTPSSDLVCVPHLPHMFVSVSL